METTVRDLIALTQQISLIVSQLKDQMLPTDIDQMNNEINQIKTEIDNMIQTQVKPKLEQPIDTRTSFTPPVRRKSSKSLKINITQSPQIQRRNSTV